MEPDEYSLQRGEQSAKFGMTLIAFSNLALLIPAISTLRYNEQAYIILGGLGTVGFVMFFAGISKYDYKEPWAFWFLLIYTCLLLLNPPVGTALGIFSLYYLIRTQSAFFMKKE